MPIGSGVGSDSIKILLAGVQQLMGRPLQDAEKAILADLAQQMKDAEDHLAADLEGVIDHAIEKLAAKLNGLRIVIPTDPK